MNFHFSSGRVATAQRETLNTLGPQVEIYETVFDKEKEGIYIIDSGAQCESSRLSDDRMVSF